jgi:hypothetical protein
LRITEAQDYDVVGTLLESTEPAPKVVSSGFINIALPPPFYEVSNLQES